MKNCPHQKTDNKGYTNCTRGDSHIGLCQNPCPYKTTAYASMCISHVFKRANGAYCEAISTKEACETVLRQRVIIVQKP